MDTLCISFEACKRVDEEQARVIKTIYLSVRSTINDRVHCDGVPAWVKRESSQQVVKGSFTIVNHL